MKTPSRKPKAKLLCSETAILPTRLGPWKIMVFNQVGSADDGCDHVALMRGDLAGAEGLLTRVHSECETSEVFGSLKCDCNEQLQLAMRRLARAKAGLLIYLRQEGRSIGLFNKIRAYHLQDLGLDTVEANHQLGLPDDARDYTVAALLLQKLGVRSIRLMTNNPDKVRALRAAGVTVSATMRLRVKPNRWDAAYLKTKKTKMHHDL